ncbi:IMP cyclohydrolase [Helicobacter pametensis]|uniref:IMP cyclohydrolase n=1 Tax=Helicobacter pametensis TaxID=95149 RepID=UPI0004B88646|nr:IMP cyclohydrolase [Helicobacter pametensis]
MKLSIKSALMTHRYLGRGIIIGLNPQRDQMFLAYFLMGRSPNSQNRVFYSQGNDVKIDFFDPSKVEDASLIFYPPLVHFGHQVIITNGDQTQSILQALEDNQSFEEALRGREFEPDAPHFTPRISAILTLSPHPTYKLSLLKSLHGSCARFFYEYESLAGIGHLIHTYIDDKDPLPSFEGEPKVLDLPSDFDEFSSSIWDSLDAEYKVALCTQCIHLHTQEIQTLIFNSKEK